MAVIAVMGCGSGSPSHAFDECSIIACAPDAAAPAVNDAGGATLGEIPDSGSCPGTGVIFPAATALAPPDVPACCAAGFELGDATVKSTYAITSLDADGAPASTLDVDVATYEEADRIVIFADTASGATSTLLDTCELKTWTQSDTTGGKTRPVDESIRQFHVAVPSGTTRLRFDFGAVVSPMYLRAIGLCNFDVERTTQAFSWRAVAATADASTCAPEGGAPIR